MLKRATSGIGGKLLLSYLLVTGVAVATLFLGVSLLAPAFFDRSMMGMMGMMGGGTAGMMSRGIPAEGMSDAMGTAVAGSFRAAMRSSLLLATGAGVLAAVVASILFTRRVIGPVHRMAYASGRIAAGHYAERVPAGTDELGELADSFNQMAASLEETERRRLALVGDVAHELRTPLATLEGYAEGLLDGVVESTPETFALLHREAGRLSRLVDDLQELSRAEAKQLPLHPQQVAPVQLVDSAVARLRKQYEEKGLNIDVEIPEHLPDVLADEGRTVQVLTNLLGNALHYTPLGGRVVVKARRRDSEIEFAVIDSGIGLAPDHVAHVFERFYRVDRSRSRAGGGSGIGLTIAKHLVEAQGGNIRADSAGPGRGATFSFTLPIAR